jgi:FixJ family two-component response regulator
MPEIDGLELVEQLTAMGIRLPTIMITGRSTKELCARAARIGISMVLEKPLSDSSLRDAIRSATGL